MKENRNKTKKKIVIIGARIDGQAGVVLDLINLTCEFEVVGFIDNTPSLQQTRVNEIPVIGSTDDLETINIPSEYTHIAIGDNVARGRIYYRLKERGLKVATLVHPTATISKSAQIEEGCFVGPNAVINKGTTIGAVSIINTGAIIEHDSQIGFSVHVAPGTRTAGRVRIDDYAFVGLGSTILPGIIIGSGAMVGAGSTVVKNVPPKTTVFGYAAKKHHRNIYMDAKSDVESPGKIYVAQPTLPDYPLIETKFRDIASSLILSNFAKYSIELEKTIEEMFSVKRALAFPNATTALMLAIRTLDLKGEVIVPSFTFSATGHAIVWNGLMPVFADIDFKTFNIDLKDVERKITDKTSAILAVHIFGNPADIKSLEAVAKKHNLKLLFDSAHALGSRYHDQMIGCFGDLECFSLSGTKVITSAEGGICTSNNEELMAKINLGRNYGADKDYDCQLIGLNGKMSEFHAAIALESLAILEESVEKRNKIVQLYKNRLSEMPGIIFQEITPNCRSTFKDFAIVIDRNLFGMDRDALVKCLNEENIFPKTYFFPLHRMKVYQKVLHRAENLQNTEKIADNIVCLHIYSHMSEDTVDKICYAILRARLRAKKNDKR